VSRAWPAGRRAPGLAAGLALIALAALAAPLRAAYLQPAPPYRPKEFAFVFDGEQFHLFYMLHNIDLPDDSTERDIGHAISFDLYHWTDLDPILSIRPDSWDNLHLWSPTVVQDGDHWDLFYAGVTNVPGVTSFFQRIGLATSTDLFTWTRVDAPVLGCTQIPWTYCDSTFADGGDFRDPFVMADPSNPAGWIMIVATRADVARDRMLGGMAASPGDPTRWADRMPMWNTDAAHTFSPLFESPTMIDHDGLWYLFYTTNSGHPINYETSPDPLGDSTSWSNQRHISTEVTERTDDWFGPELLRVGPHDYFAAVNSEKFTIEIREIVWGVPPHFDLTEPSTEGLAVGPADAAGAIELRLAHAAPDGARRFEVRTRAPTHVRIDLLEIGGRRVAKLADRDVDAGIAEFEWSGEDESGRRAPPGIYLARLSSGLGTRALRFAVLR